MRRDSTIRPALVALIAVAIIIGGPAVVYAGASPIGAHARLGPNTANNQVATTISVGSDPVGVAFSPSSALAYVTNSGSGTVSVINTASNTVTDTITVGTQPYGVAFNPGGSLAYVTNAGSGTVSVINTASGTVTGTISVGSDPMGVAFDPDGALAYVTNSGGGTVSVINTGTDAVTGTILVGRGPNGVAFNPGGALAYVADSGDNAVSVIDTASGAVTGTIPVGANPHGVAFSPSGAVAYVADYGSATVSVISAASGTVIDTITIGKGYPIGVAFSPSGAVAYVTNYRGYTVSTIDVASGKVTGAVSAGTDPDGVAFDPSGTLAYVASNGEGAVSVISNLQGSAAQAMSIIPTDTCSAMMADAGSALGNAGTYTSLLTYATLIMLVMFTVAGLAYALGYAFGIEKLTRFSKTELGEIAITAIVVGVLIGTWSAVTAAHNVTSGSGLLPIAGSQFNGQVFVSDCNYLIGGSEQILSPLMVIALENIPLSMASSTTITLEPTGFGISFRPLAGLQFLNSLLGLLVDIGGAVFGVLFGFGAFMAIIYALFPMFLFIGIVLRTIPVMRAAGGAFLGLFVGFYIFFPLLLNLMLSYLAASTPAAMALQFCGQTVSGTNALQYFNALNGCLGGTGLTYGSLSGAGSGLVTGFDSILEINPVSVFITNIIEPAFYTLFAVVISLVLSYDFMETLASLLGSPSLKSHTTLRSVI